MRSFMRTTIVGGFLFLTPLAFVVAVFGKAFQVIKVVATPLDNLFPIETVAGVAFVEVLTALIMLLCCFVAGLFAVKFFVGLFVIETLFVKLFIKFLAFVFRAIALFELVIGPGNIFARFRRQIFLKLLN